MKSLKAHDFVFVHVEAADEAGHNGDLRQKIGAIENFDRFVVGTILKEFENKKNVRILVIPDHPTPVEKRTHVADPVPFAIWGKGISSNSVASFGESQAKASGFRVEAAYEILPRLLPDEPI